MFRLRLAGLVLALSGGGCAPEASDANIPQVAAGQAVDDTRALQVEVTAARDILRRYAGHRAVVDSMFAIAEQAPGAASGEVRPDSRTRALRDSLAETQEADSSVVLHLSKPSITAGVARITVTVDFPDAQAPAGRGYETVDYTLDENDATWRIRTRVQLGIT